MIDLNSFYWLELENFCNNNTHTHIIHKQVKQSFDSSNKDVI